MTRFLGSNVIRLAVLSFVLAGVGLFGARAASATITQCPAVGYDTGCSVLYTVNADGSVTTTTDTTQGPTRAPTTRSSASRTTRGGSSRVRRSPAPTSSASRVTGHARATTRRGRNFPGSYTPPAGCPFAAANGCATPSAGGDDGGPGNYEGPGVCFSVTDASHGTVIFDPPLGLPSGDSTWWSLEGPPDAAGGAGIVLPVIAQPGSISAVEGAKFSGVVGKATDADSTLTPADFSCQINWGDGSAVDTACTVGGPNGGPYTISGNHTYAEEGTYFARFLISENSLPANSSNAVSPATVADAALEPGALTLTGGVEGVSSGTASFVFTDANPGATSADFTSGGGSTTIDWGDGHSSPGTVSQPGGLGTAFTITGNHQYAEEGTNTVTVTVVDDGGATVMTSGSATVADAKITATCGTPAVSLQSFSGTVATLSDANLGATTADFTSGGGSTTIDWGDGTTSSGTVTGSGGTFTITGSHTYSSTGNHVVTTSVIDDGGSTSVTGSCQVLVYAFAPGGGAFVIGTGNRANTTAVTFWGAQWWKLNTLSGGAAPAAFKGYALNPTVPSCGTPWSTDPGNSAPPPTGPLPAYMGVIVTSNVTKSGSQIKGDTFGIVIVKTNAGYMNDPGHAGTGTVVAQVC